MGIWIMIPRLINHALKFNSNTYMYYYFRVQSLSVYAINVVLKPHRGGSRRGTGGPVPSPGLE